MRDVSGLLYVSILFTFYNLAKWEFFKKNKLMRQLPKMKHLQQKKNLTVKINPSTDEIYRVGRQNGWDVSEIARQTLEDKFQELAEELKRPAS